MDNDPGIGTSEDRMLVSNAVEWVHPSINPNEPIVIVHEDNAADVG